MINNINRYHILFILYLIIIIIFKFVNKSFYRFILTFSIALLVLYFFKITKKDILIYLLLTLFAIIIEIIFIKFFNKTWFYYEKEFFVIPYWLISLWFCAIIFLIEMYKLISKSNILF